MSFGLTEKQLEHYPQALNAFAMGALTNADSPYPHILSAECYIELGENDDAKMSLKIALEAPELAEISTSEEVVSHINLLQKQIR